MTTQREFWSDIGRTSDDGGTSEWSVRFIESKVAMRMVMDYHYSQRKVGSKESFGLFCGDYMIGCCVFSIPASYTLCNGVCGKDFRQHVLELSRLVVTTEKQNAASFFISRALKSLGNHVIVSYADPNVHVGHVGYVYQATNWLYTGQSNAEPKWVHPDTHKLISYTRRHIDKKAKAIGLEWTDLIKISQLGKHRYVTFSGDKRFKKRAKANLKYGVVKEYPKGVTCRHYFDQAPVSTLF